MPRFKIVKGETSVAFYLKLNTKVAPTDDVHIRKAIALATDYDTIRCDDPARRRADRAAAEDLRRSASRHARAEVRPRRRQGGDRQERLCRQDGYSR